VEDAVRVGEGRMTGHARTMRRPSARRDIVRAQRTAPRTLRRPARNARA
jgi:hypothetical protein